QPGSRFTFVANGCANSMATVYSKTAGRPFCTNCQFTGHTIFTCYKIHGYPVGHRLHGQPWWPPKPRSSTLFHSSAQATSTHVVAVALHVTTLPNSSALPGSCPLESSTPGYTFTPDQYQKLLSLISTPPATGQ
ncbi:hypothetical protein Dimus_015740, partial [Dionaea muscipula]